MRHVLNAATAAVLVLAAAAPAAAAPAPASASGDCSPGELCLWAKPGYGGSRTVHELADTDVNSCVPLPEGTTAKSFVNRTRKLVTTYQSRECATEGDFVTFPSGTWVPESRHTIRAFQIVDQS
ncbi:peptidase inhibitor family I36 protein [Streptomyces sp. NBC_01262]|uniref:peptidase inhibitor family I36 protein n=1 Tax=Streptomyces sp. NBC_01262 TaxID=2903803 RepID=UPI002E327A87|nr:peptidase inhibitor family I36 protein [Streptomyces sp. NBC_01262]